MWRRLRLLLRLRLRARFLRRPVNMGTSSTADMDGAAAPTTSTAAARTAKAEGKEVTRSPPNLRRAEPPIPLIARRKNLGRMSAFGTSGHHPRTARCPLLGVKGH
jgi:hypothetical protein